MSKPHIKEKKTIKIKQVDTLKKSQPADKARIISEKQQAENELIQVKKELGQIQRKKEEQIISTKKAIDKEKENWETEKQKLMTAAEKEGYEAGFLLGKEESKKEFAHLIKQANTITDTARKDYNKTMEKSEITILDLAIHTANKVIKQKIEERPDSFLPIVKTAIKELKDQRVITIYLHPENYPAVMEQKGELLQILEDDMQLSIYAKEDVAINGCLINHPFGQIDAGVDTQLEQIRKALYDIALENRS